MTPVLQIRNNFSHGFENSVKEAPGAGTPGAMGLWVINQGRSGLDCGLFVHNGIHPLHTDGCGVTI